MTYRITFNPSPAATPPGAAAPPQDRPEPWGIAALALALLLAFSAACATGDAGTAEGEAGTAAPAMESEAVAAPMADEPAPEVVQPLPAEAPDDPELCFYGPVTETPIGQVGDGGAEPTVTADLLLRRILKPDESLIIEESVRVDRAANRRTRPFRTLYEVDGDSFELREASGQYSGSGTLEGEAWRWSAWDFTYRLQSGIQVQGRYEIRPAGGSAGSGDRRYVLAGTKTALGPDGSEVLSLHEELAQISLQECAERLSL